MSQEKFFQTHEWEKYGYFHLFSMKGKKIFSNFLKNRKPKNDMAFHSIFSRYGYSYILRHWELDEFLLTVNL